MMSDQPPQPVKLHRKQFIIGPEPVRVTDTWQARSMDEHVHLSHCPELRASFINDQIGRSWALLGLATQSVAKRPDPSAEIAGIAESHTNEMVRLYESWAGRWALVGDGRVHPDAGSMLGIYHGKDGDGRTWASSSAALLADQLNFKVNDRAALRYERGISWHPLPSSGLAGISCLLPSQVLNMRSGLVEPRELLPAPRNDADADEMIDAVSAAFKECLRRLAALNEPIWMSLSAGGDSRVVFAAAMAAKLPVKAFTRISTRMSVADYLLPPKLAESVGCDHQYIRPPGADPSRAALAMKHTANQVSLGDAQPLIERHRDDLTGITLGGQCFGVGKLWLRRGTHGHYENDHDLIRAIIVAHGESMDSPKIAALTDWLNWMKKTPVEGLDWRDRFYIEQRTAGWQSVKEQLYDVQPHERFFPINCARTYGLLLSVPERRRKGFAHHFEIVRRLAPTLADSPLNPRGSSFGLGRALHCSMFDIRSWRNPRHMLFSTARLIRKCMNESDNQPRP